ncbi:MAG: T9SS type A sorting domain-containing protein [Bacteroidota bacterium]
MNYRTFLVLALMSCLLVGVVFAQAPVNDDLCNATPLTVGLTCTASNGDLTNATLETNETVGSCYSGFPAVSNSVWYSFTAPSTGLVLISANKPSFATLPGGILTLYSLNGTNCDLDSLVELGCNGGEGLGAQAEPLPSLSAELTAGETYYIQLAGLSFIPGTNIGTFCIDIEELQPPANDDVCSPTAISLDSPAVPFSNVGATSLFEFAIAPPFDPSDFLGLNGWGLNFQITRSVWFSFVAPASGMVEIDLSDRSIEGNFNSKVAVYSATDCNDLSTFSLLEAQDNTILITDQATGSGFLSFQNYLEQVSCLTPGETYYVLVDGASSALGQTTNAFGLGLIAINTINLPALDIDQTIYDVSCAADTNAALIGWGTGGANGASLGQFSYTYQWSTGDSTPYLYDVSPGIYTLTVTDGCDSTISKDFVVEAREGADIDLEDEAQVCPGDMMMLAASASGGSPLDSSRVYYSSGSNIGAAAGKVFVSKRERANEAIQISADTLPLFSALTYANGQLYGLASANQVFRIDPLSGTYTLVDTLVGNAPSERFRDIDYNYATASLVANTDSSRIYTFDPQTGTTNFLAEIAIPRLEDMAIDTSGTYYFTSDRDDIRAESILKYDQSSGQIDTLTTLLSLRQGITDLAVDPADNALLVYLIRPSNNYPETNVGEIQRWDETNSALVEVSYFRHVDNAISGLAIAPAVRDPYTYAWSPAAGLSDPNIANPMATVDSTTTWVLTVMDDCGTSTDTITITVDVAELSLNSTPDNGSNNGSASVTQSGGIAPFTYSWSNGATTDSITGLGMGVYTVTVTDALGCTSLDSVEVTSNVGIDKLAQAGVSSWSIYPNPANGSFNIKADLRQAFGEAITLYSTQGQVLRKYTLDRNAQIQQQIDISDLAAGMYLVSLSTTKGNVWQQLVVR